MPGVSAERLSAINEHAFIAADMIVFVDSSSASLDPDVVTNNERLFTPVTASMPTVHYPGEMPQSDVEIGFWFHGSCPPWKLFIDLKKTGQTPPSLFSIK